MLAKRTYTALLKSLRALGFERPFVERTFLPDWWDRSCETDPELLGEVEFSVARFLDTTVSAVRNPGVALARPAYAGAQLRNAHRATREEVDPAIHLGFKVAGAAITSLRPGVPAYLGLPAAHEWREELLAHHRVPDLPAIVGSLWAKGVPVLHVTDLPIPKFHGMSCVVGGRPVIVVGYDDDIPAKLLFTIVHEAGHIANGDCERTSLVVDVEEESDGSDIEARADSFAFSVLNGRPEPWKIDGDHAKALASSAMKVSRAERVDPGHLVLSWARAQESPDVWQSVVPQAMRALWLAPSGGRSALREHLDRFVDVRAASDLNQRLLNCLWSGAGHNAGDH